MREKDEIKVVRKLMHAVGSREVINAGYKTVNHVHQHAYAFA